MATVPVALSRPVARRPSRRTWAVALLASAAVAYVVLRGQFLLPHDESAPVFGVLNDVRAWVDANRQASPILSFLIGAVRGGIGSLVDSFQAILAALGWTGSPSSVAHWATSSAAGGSLP